MIADFRTAPLGDPDAIYVELFWRGDERRAMVRVSIELRQALALRDYPDVVVETMSVPSAVSYGVFLAMISGFALRVTGDLSVWDSAWGGLEPVSGDDWEQDTAVPSSF